MLSTPTSTTSYANQTLPERRHVTFEAKNNNEPNHSRVPQIYMPRVGRVMSHSTVATFYYLWGACVCVDEDHESKIVENGPTNSRLRTCHDHFSWFTKFKNCHLWRDVLEYNFVNTKAKNQGALREILQSSVFFSWLFSHFLCRILLTFSFWVNLLLFGASQSFASNLLCNTFLLFFNKYPKISRKNEESFSHTFPTQKVVSR